MRRFTKVIVHTFFLLALMPFTLQAGPVDFSLPGLDGEEIKLSQFRGKWVLVNYWATWCPPCVEEMPELELFHSEHKDGNAVVLGVNMERIDIELLKQFVKDQFVSYPIAYTRPAQRTELGKVPALPTSYLVSPEGEVVARQVGTVSKKMLENFIANYKPQGVEEEK
ncbi:MAG: TlpA disulfide reductase family protein [Candidatus Sedimenticola sp. 6PFRAG7]